MSYQFSPGNIPFKAIKPIELEDFDQLISTKYDGELLSKKNIYVKLHIEFKHRCDC